MAKKTNVITKYCKECGTGNVKNSTVCVECGAELKTSAGMQFVSPIKSKEDIEKMKQYLKSKSLRNWALFTLGINSALRISDIINLKIDDVVDKDGNIRDRIKIQESKTEKPKEFPLTKKVIEALTEYLPTCKQNGALFVSQRSPLQKPAQQRDGAISRSYANVIISEAAKEVGIKDNIGSHSLRKTWAYQAWISGVPLTQVSEALNHSSERITRRYLGLNQESLDKVYLDLDL